MSGILDPIRIHSLQWDYDVEFFQEVDACAQAAMSGLHPEETFVICDENVAELYAPNLRGLLSGFPVLILPANEETKSFQGVGKVIDWLISQRAVRSSTIIAIGGGCIQDVVSFTAHIYYRGISWTFLPTTLLSQSDSCIGAKSGINVLPYKNQLGVLHSPLRILVAAEFLGTLPEIEIASGYGEIVKLSVTSSRHFLSDLELELNREGLRNKGLLHLTRASLLAKQEIIEEDEYESDLRRVLNYGHSFGHALEALAGHKIPHGLGVLWGIDAINWLGSKWGLTDPEVANRMRKMTAAHFDFTLPFVPTSAELIEMVSRDKKMANGQMNFAVLLREGEFEIVPRPLNQDLRDDLNEYLGSNFVFRPS